MREPFILILSTSGGAGHHRAAEALLEATHRSPTPIRAAHHDCLDFTSKSFKRLYAESYLAMVNTIPEVWGYLYSQSEKKPYTKKGLLRIFDHFNYSRYLKTLRDMAPDIVLCTHFLPYISLAERDLPKEGIRAPFVAATTDFDVHQLWVNDCVQRYFVHDAETAWQLASKGIDQAIIGVTGIPVGSGFAGRVDKQTARQHLAMPKDRFTVMVLSGGFGVGHVQDITEGVVSLLGSFPSRAFNLIVICGRNEVLQKDLEKRTFPGNIHKSIMGYVSNVHELMDAADILVSKSGGLTSAEAMAKGLPMIIVDPIPGQETRNADMIVERGAGVLAHDYHNLVFKLRETINDPKRLEMMRERTSALAHPRAAETILNDILHRYLRPSSPHN
jgi:processive 1,2-diacylglycerol beta-glucosyltransferase